MVFSTYNNPIRVQLVNTTYILFHLSISFSTDCYYFRFQLQISIQPTSFPHMVLKLIPITIYNAYTSKWKLLLSFWTRRDSKENLLPWSLQIEKSLKEYSYDFQWTAQQITSSKITTRQTEFLTCSNYTAACLSKKSKLNYKITQIGHTQVRKMKKIVFRGL